MKVETKFIFLMHPKEFKYEKAGTGRLTHLALADSEIHMGVGFDDHEAVQALLKDPAYYPVLLYPGEGSRNVSEGQLLLEDLGGRRLMVFLLDGTWACAKKMLKLSPCLQRLPRLMFSPKAKSRFIIKQQPHELCLSTLEATHELLLALEGAGLDQYPDKKQLLGVFAKMQEYQISCAQDPEKRGYRQRPYKPPEERVLTGRTSKHARKLFY